MSLNIEELKKCVERVEIGLLTLQRAKFKEDIESILSVCQLVCGVSDSLPPKKEYLDETTVDGTISMIRENDNRRIYNQSREEDLLWLTKKMMRWEDIILDVSTMGGNGRCPKAIVNALKQDMGVV